MLGRIKSVLAAKIIKDASAIPAKKDFPCRSSQGTVSFLRTVFGHGDFNGVLFVSIRDNFFKDTRIFFEIPVNLFSNNIRAKYSKSGMTHSKSFM